MPVFGGPAHTLNAAGMVVNTRGQQRGGQPRWLSAPTGTGQGRTPHRSSAGRLQRPGDRLQPTGSPGPRSGQVAQRANGRSREQPGEGSGRAAAPRRRFRRRGPAPCPGDFLRSRPAPGTLEPQAGRSRDLGQNRGGREQKVALEAWLPRWPSLVATSAGRELDHALTGVRNDMIRQIGDEKTKRELRKARASRRGPA